MLAKKFHSSNLAAEMPKIRRVIMTVADYVAMELVERNFIENSSFVSLEDYAT